MRRYTQRTLLPGEHVVYVAHLHWSIYRSGLFLLLCAAFIKAYAAKLAGFVLNAPVPHLFHDIIAVAAVVTAVIGAIGLIFAFLRQKATEIVVTNDRLIIKYGLCGVVIHQVLLAKITGVDIEQTTLGRLEGYGKVSVAASACIIPPIEDVENPFHLQSALMRCNSHRVLDAAFVDMKGRQHISGGEPTLLDGKNKENGSKPNDHI